MTKWVIVDRRADSATVINLDGALRFDYRAYSRGGGRVRIYFNGTDIEISSERDAEAYEKVMAFLAQEADFSPARPAENDGGSKVETES